MITINIIHFYLSTPFVIKKVNEAAGTCAARGRKKNATIMPSTRPRVDQHENGPPAR
jgi:hypothetical protein